MLSVPASLCSDMATVWEERTRGWLAQLAWTGKCVQFHIKVSPSTRPVLLPHFLYFVATHPSLVNPPRDFTRIRIFFNAQTCIWILHVIVVHDQ